MLKMFKNKSDEKILKEVWYKKACYVESKDINLGRFVRNSASQNTKTYLKCWGEKTANLEFYTQ